MWRQRAAAKDKLATLRVYRATICGCAACHDQDKATVLDRQIRDELAAVAYLSDRLSTREGVPCSH